MKSEFLVLNFDINKLSYMSFMVHLILGVGNSKENQENWYSMKN